MLDRLAMLFILLGISTSLMILKDLIRTPQSIWIMNLVWPLTGLYMPFFGWLAWWYFARQRRPVFPLLSQKKHPVAKPEPAFFLYQPLCGRLCAGEYNFSPDSFNNKLYTFSFCRTGFRSYFVGSVIPFQLTTAVFCTATN